MPPAGLAHALAGAGGVRIVALCRLRASRVRFPSRRLPTRPLVKRVVQTVARFRSIGYESDKIAHRLHKAPATVRRINRAGLDAIAAGLRRDGVAVF
jgi:hypothetical protein